MHHLRSHGRLSVLSGGQGRSTGAARRSENPVLDRLYYFVPSAVPDFCTDCGAPVGAAVHAWGPAWQCTAADCRRAAPQLVEITHLELLLRASPDWTCACCGDALTLRFDQQHLLPACPQRTTTDWEALALQARAADDCTCAG